MPLVPDVSVAAAWILPDERAVYSDQVMSRVERNGAVVPSLWQFELANVLALALRRNRITVQEVRDGIARIQGLPITTDDPGPLDLLSALPWLAVQESLTAYDAAYLELAIRRALPLATLDCRLARAAKAHGVALV